MTIAPDDRGFTLGDGLFETVLAEDGALALWPAHLARLAQGCAVLGLPAPDPQRLVAAAQDALASAGLRQGRAAIRLTWTAGSGGRGLDRPAAPAPRLSVTAAAAPMPQGPASLCLVTPRRNEGSVTSRLKTVSYLDNVLARREASTAGYDEGLMLNTRGEVACAAAANIFWERAGRIFTPALDCGVLAGVVRSAVIAAAETLNMPVAQGRFDATGLQRAEAAFITNSLIGVRPVSRLGERSLAPSRLTQQLAQLTVWDLRGRR